jgi:hypothetical protein
MCHLCCGPQVISQLHVFSGQPPEELAHCMTFFVLRSVSGKVGSCAGLPRDQGVMHEGPWW